MDDKMMMIDALRRNASSVWIPLPSSVRQGRVKARERDFCWRRNCLSGWTRDSREL
jgi:hypothetical protein